jgi:hypothetical protein
VVLLDGWDDHHRLLCVSQHVAGYPMERKAVHESAASADHDRFCVALLGESHEGLADRAIDEQGLVLDGGFSQGRAPVGLEHSAQRFAPFGFVKVDDAFGETGDGKEGRLEDVHRNDRRSIASGRVDGPLERRLSLGGAVDTDYELGWCHGGFGRSDVGTPGTPGRAVSL